MKQIKKVLGGGVLCAVLVFSGGVAAQAQEVETDTNTPRQTRMEDRQQRVEERIQKKEERQQDRQVRREEIQTQREEKKEERQENREERQEMRQERRSNIASAHADRLEQRFSAYTERLNALAEKIDSRLDVLKGEGRDVTNAQNKLGEARAAIESAADLGESAVSGFAAIDPEKYEEQRAQVLAARDLANQAREKFRSAQALLREAVSLARDAQ